MMTQRERQSLRRLSWVSTVAFLLASHSSMVTVGIKALGYLILAVLWVLGALWQYRRLVLNEED